MIYISKLFKSGEYIQYEERGAGRTMLTVNVSHDYSDNQRKMISQTITEFIKKGKKKVVNEVFNAARNMKHLIGLIEIVYMDKHVKRTKTVPATDIILNKFYIPY